MKRSSKALPYVFVPMLATGALLTSPAHALWTGAGELGAVAARGNTDSDSANAKLDIANEIDRWKHSLWFNSLYGASNDYTTNNRWEVRWQTDYKLTEPLYWFGGLRYERDHFGAYAYQESVTTGLGYKLFDDDTTKLSVQGGVGAKRSQPQTLVKDEDNSDHVLYRVYEDEETRGSIIAGAKFEHKLTANTKVLDTLLVEATSANTFTQNDLALQVSMSDRFALSVAYGIRQNTSPPPDNKKTDQITTLSVVYKLNK